MSVKRLSRVEQQQRTRERVIDAAERLFVDEGFHAVSVDRVAAEAGYTKGAVYSNFHSKEDLFFAVYERRAARGIAELEGQFAAARDSGEAMDAVANSIMRRRGRDDGWLAAFFEFWAHVVRRPALRARFGEIHLRAQEPFVRAIEAHARERGYELPDDPRRLAIAGYAMQLGLQLERLTLPNLVDPHFGRRMNRLFLDDLARSTSRRNGDRDGH
jgi:AcrR family transcriptional regulator